MSPWMRRAFLTAIALASGVLLAPLAHAEDTAKTEIYGFVMMDAGYNSIAIDPAWFDVQRPTKLPAFENQFGNDGNTFFSVRQTRFGAKSWLPTEKGTLKTIFEWELFGSGVDAGQTTLRLRHAWGELGKVGAGQYWSAFVDVDAFPNIVEYWGPPGLAWYRNIQIRYTPIMQGDNKFLKIALERPGASGDQGVYADRVDFSGITPRFPLPDLTGSYRMPLGKGYVQLGGVVRDIQWEDNNPAPPDLAGGVTGWGAQLSTNLKPNDDNVVRLAVLHGEGVENYLNDAPVDVATKPSANDPLIPEGVALPVTGASAFLDHNWSKKASTSIGYSIVHIENSDGQADDAFRTGHYVIGNALFYPVTNLMWGVEGGWIRRENFRDGFTSDDTHIQISARYNFSVSIGGGH
jgi:outer membrane DcaP-like protein